MRRRGRADKNSVDKDRGLKSARPYGPLHCRTPVHGCARYGALIDGTAGRVSELSPADDGRPADFSQIRQDKRDPDDTVEQHEAARVDTGQIEDHPEEDRQ